jgi:ABC-type nitrate/sulfonate/bicarbonate transport system ATPase subunit
MSGGEGKRVSIARAIASNPKLLIMDEPFTNLDLETKKDTAEIINIIHKRKKLSILTVGHNYEDNLRISKKIFKLKDGILNEEKY